MKTFFIVNPVSGKGQALRTLKEALASVNGEYEIYETKGPRDATEFIRTYCTSHPEEKVRFCACGGDGTLNEVVNGVVGFENADVTCYPCGSGNDFVKYYGGADVFMDVNALMNAPSAPIDLIKAGDKYSINVTNFGFDTSVCRTMEKVKTKPIIGGKNAYNFGVFKSVLTAMKTKASVYADGELLNENGMITLCTLANGKYVGGQFCCAPRSQNNDGLMELCLVKPISAFKLISIIGTYTKGEHLDDPRLNNILVYRRCKSVRVEGDEKFAYTLDGEIITAPVLECEVVHNAVRFAVPGLVAEDADVEKRTVTV